MKTDTTIGTTTAEAEVLAATAAAIAAGQDPFGDDGESTNDENNNSSADGDGASEIAEGEGDGEGEGDALTRSNLPPLQPTKSLPNQSPRRATRPPTRPT